VRSMWTDTCTVHQHVYNVVPGSPGSLFKKKFTKNKQRHEHEHLLSTITTATAESLDIS
jgi:hypothetical protein